MPSLLIGNQGFLLSIAEKILIHIVVAFFLNTFNNINICGQKQSIMPLIIPFILHKLCYAKNAISLIVQSRNILPFVRGAKPITKSVRKKSRVTSMPGPEWP